MVWAEKNHKDYLAPIPKLLEVINSKLLKVMNLKLLEVDSYLTVSLSEKKGDKWNIAFRLVQGMLLITEIKKKPAEAMLWLGVMLAACGGLGMYWKIGMVGSDSFEEEQRKEIRIFIPIILFWLFGGKNPPWMSHPPLFLSTTMTARKSQQGFCYTQVVANLGFCPSQE